MNQSTDIVVTANELDFFGRIVNRDPSFGPRLLAAAHAARGALGLVAAWLDTQGNLGDPSIDAEFDHARALIAGAIDALDSGTDLDREPVRP